MAALHALRLEAGMPWFPADFNDAMIPHEAGAREHAHQLHKGLLHGPGDCRAGALARPREPEARVAEIFELPTPPAPGTKLLAGGAEVGFVSSAAFSPAIGSAIGMGYLRREQFAPGSVVELDGRHGGSVA